VLPAGVPLGRVIGVPVRVAPSWFLFAGLVVLAYGPALAPRFGAPRAYATAAAFAGLLLVSVLLHEVGHCVVARTFGLPVRSITVTFLAGLTDVAEPPQTPWREFAVAAAGPMVSLLLAAVAAGAAGQLETDSLLHLLALGTAVLNALVAGFNLLPGLPLDGGRVLRAALWRLSGDGARATVLAAAAGRVVAVVGVPLVVVVLLPGLGLGGPSAVTVLLAVFVAWFVYSGATASMRHARLASRLPAGSAGRLSRPALSVPTGLPLAEAIRRAHAEGLLAVVVVDDEGRPLGIVDEAAVRAVPEHRRPWVAVADLARTAEDALDPCLGGEQLLAELRRRAHAAHLVGAGRADGLVSGGGDQHLRVLLTADVARAVR
jgi:Zn-dependent protease